MSYSVSYFDLFVVSVHCLIWTAYQHFYSTISLVNSTYSFISTQCHDV
jgi:hypothetical protein